LTTASSCSFECYGATANHWGAEKQEQGSPGGGSACIDLLNRMWDVRTKRRITSKQVLQHQWLTQAQPTPKVDEVHKQLEAWMQGRFDANKNTLLGQMFALKPGTDKMLKAEHEEEARHRN